MRLGNKLTLTESINLALKEQELQGDFVNKFLAKYNSLYGKLPEVRDGKIYVDNIKLIGSGQNKAVEATIDKYGVMEIYNEEWGLAYNGESIKDVEEMSQYWFYDNFENNEEFRSKVTKAVQRLYKDMLQLQETTGLNESFDNVQYWGSKNQFGYTVRQLKIDYANKTYAVGSFKQSVDKKATNKAISEKIEELKAMGFKEETKESLHEDDEQCIDIQYILDNYEYPPEVEPEEIFNSNPDSSYFKVVRDANEASKFNYQSDYWGSADGYQEEMVGLLEELENYIVDGTTLCMYDDGAEIKFKVTGVAIDKQYNSISHAKILFKEVGTVQESARLNEFYSENKKERKIPFGLKDEKSQDVINGVVGQLSDGMWENSPGMERYWKFTDGTDGNGNIIVYDGYVSVDEYAGMNRYGTKRYNTKWIYSAFSRMDDTAVKKYFATKIKQIVKEEGLEWNRNNTQPCEYLDYHSGVTVRDAYRVYDRLLGRADRITDEPPVEEE